MKKITLKRNNVGGVQLSKKQMKKVLGGNAKTTPGSNTAQCIQDAYSNHGWASVALGLATALEPWGSGIVALACADENDFT